MNQHQKSNLIGEKHSQLENIQRDPKELATKGRQTLVGWPTGRYYLPAKCTRTPHPEASKVNERGGGECSHTPRPEATAKANERGANAPTHRWSKGNNRRGA